ncbi:hypothetical protein GCM10025881_08820 [Pseudolysinimonas kribbensis]|uniref:Uncharacterized protein n=1 Tax=Pseudolysinimonas kribbensis TaxID=433641 RepID=A0ABQ6K0S1_9MICO|nr:hypothetical protein [Pseudolysinimonas kribbensis]GMA94058.1 hypothetical protein GCM10025881_08820 [Pseudolysinimonas kribbensis]
MTALRSLLGLARLAAGRVAAACAPVAGIVSPLGAIVALAAVAAGVASAVLGWAELSYLALTLVCGLLVAALFLIGRASYRVTIELSPRRVVAGSARSDGCWSPTPGRGARVRAGSSCRWGADGPSSTSRRSPPARSTRSCSPCPPRTAP